MLKLPLSLPCCSKRSLPCPFPFRTPTTRTPFSRLTLLLFPWSMVSVGLLLFGRLCVQLAQHIRFNIQHRQQQEEQEEQQQQQQAAKPTFVSFVPNFFYLVLPHTRFLACPLARHICVRKCMFRSENANFHLQSMYLYMFNTQINFVPHWNGSSSQAQGHRSSRRYIVETQRKVRKGSSIKPKIKKSMQIKLREKKSQQRKKTKTIRGIFVHLVFLTVQNRKRSGHATAEWKKKCVCPPLDIRLTRYCCCCCHCTHYTAPLITFLMMMEFKCIFISFNSNKINYCVAMAFQSGVVVMCSIE